MILFIPASGQETAADWYVLGHELIDQGNIDQGILALDRAIELNNSYSAAWYLKIFTLANYCRYGEAIDAANESLKINSRDASLWYQKAQILEMYGEDLQINNKDVVITDSDISHIDSMYGEALECLNKSLELNPSDEHNSTKGSMVDVSAHLLNDKGLKLTRLKQYKEALEDFNESIKIEPYNPFFNYCKLIVLHILGSNPNASIMTQQTFAGNMKEPLSNMSKTIATLHNITPWNKTGTISGGTTISTNSFMKAIDDYIKEPLSNKSQTNQSLRSKHTVMNDINDKFNKSMNAIDAWTNAYHKQMYVPSNRSRKNEFNNITFDLPISYWRYANGTDWRYYTGLDTFLS